MATVLERFTHLGLAQNKSVLSWAGVHVSNHFCEQNLYGRKLKLQKEGDDTFEVWDYPESWTKEMDKIIIMVIERGNG